MIPKNDRPKTWNLMPKMVLKSMPNSSKFNVKIDAEKNIKVIKIHAFPNGKIIQIHCKNNGFWRFNTGYVREQKMYQNSIQIDTKIHTKINEIEAETMFEKILQTTQKTIQHRMQLNTKNIQKTSKNRRWKSIVKGSGKEHPGQFQDSITQPGRGGGGGHGGHYIILY